MFSPDTANYLIYIPCNRKEYSESSLIQLKSQDIAIIYCYNNAA